MMEEQQVIMYISGLKYPIQEHMILHNVLFIDEAHNKALKIDRLQSRALPFRRSTLIEKSVGLKTLHPSFEDYLMSYLYK